MKFKKKDLLILIVPFIVIAVIYLLLPDRIPRQFHLDGQPTSYMAKEFIFLFGPLPFVIYMRYRSKKN